VARELTVHYGESLLRLELDESRVVFDLQPADVPPVENVESEVRRALREPVGTPPLREMVRAGQQVVVMGDDVTRLTPTDRIVPLLLDELNAGGVADDDITLIIATGTHRAMTQKEVEQKYGPAVTGRIAVSNHDYLHDLISCGTTRRGTEIWANRTVLEADVRIGVGNIVPHHPTGWSGGAKILLPGVAGELTTGQMHLLGASEQQLGKVETPCREEMEDFARAVGLDFIANTVLDRNGRLVRLAAGDFIAAHREGVRWAERVLGAPFARPADLTISSTHPIDFDLFQADKGLFSAAIATRAGGEIVLLSPCRDGVSPTHPEAAELTALDDGELWRIARSEPTCDLLSVAEALYLNTAKRDFKVTLATTGIPRDVVDGMGFRYLEPSRLPDYLAESIAEEPDVTVGILRNSVETLPVIKPEGDSPDELV